MRCDNPKILQYRTFSRSRVSCVNEENDVNLGTYAQYVALGPRGGATLYGKRTRPRDNPFIRRDHCLIWPLALIVQAWQLFGFARFRDIVGEQENESVTGLRSMSKAKAQSLYLDLCQGYVGWDLGRLTSRQCDISRPCTLCKRASKACTGSSETKWKPFQPTGHETPRSPRPKRQARTQTASASPRRNQPQRQMTEDEDPTQANPQSLRNFELTDSSSTIKLAEGAFRSHHASIPTTWRTDAVPGTQTHATTGISGLNDPRDVLDEGCDMPLSRPTPRLDSSLKSFWDRGLAYLPPIEAATLLVDTYFDRAHWFMLLFHQDDFRRRWEVLYANPDRAEKATVSNVGIMGTLIMVMVIGAHYAGDHRRELLARYGVLPEKFKHELLDLVQTRLLVILSLQSLEAVQTCVLLGTHFLFHGSPVIAWPICGCGLRVAQALNLHRQGGHQGTQFNAPGELKRVEAKKRCWWAIYEIETFCSMSYGYPNAIKDEDCDLHPLDPSAKLPSPLSPVSFNEPLICNTTLLSYKYLMSKLSVILKEILTELYGRSSQSANNRPQNLINKVNQLSSKIEIWRFEIPPELILQSDFPNKPAYQSPGEMDKDIGASGARFENHIFQLQALSLWLSYQNAIILIYRPLLSYRLSFQGLAHRNEGDDPFRNAFEACRDAALRTSEIAAMPILDLASSTYAATFIGMHTFTSGLTLGILSSVERFTQASNDMKMGLQRLLSVQVKLKDRSEFSAQGMELLKRLIKQIMDRELITMLDTSKVITPMSPHKATRLNESQNETWQTTNVRNIGVTDPSVVSVVEPHSEHSHDIEDYFEFFTEDMTFQCTPDSSFLEALSDFDKVMFPAQNDVDPLNFELNNDRNLPTGIGILDQTWLWGLEGHGFPK